MSLYRNPYGLGVNTCHAPLLLRKDLLEHLALIRTVAGIRRVRCHGIFTEPIGVASRRPDGGLDFHFEQAHKVYDNLLDLGLRPQVELSFLPRVLAADPAKTVCYYQSHCSEPSSWREWGALVEAFARSLMARYGRREVARWKFEVWNEPNLAFWRPAGDPFKAYLELYGAAARGLKAAHPSLSVGGPCTARAEWVRPFITACRRRRLPLDFVSTHLYPADEFEIHGESVRERFARNTFYFRTIQEISDLARERVPCPEVYWTETASIHRAGAPTARTGREPAWDLFAGEPTWGRQTRHDLSFSGAFAARVAGTLHRNDVKLFWWNASDVYEEWEFSHRPFHGGHGLVSIGGVPKPSLHALQFAQRLDGGRIVAHADAEGAGYLAVRKDRAVRVLAWNFIHPELEPRTRQIVPAPEVTAALRDARILRVDDRHGCARQTWEALGAPNDPTPAQSRRMARAARPGEQRLRHPPAAGFRLPPNGFLLAETDENP